MEIEWRAGDGFEETIMWTPEEAMKSKSFSDSHADLIRYHCQSDAFMYECAGQGVAFLTGRAIDLAVLAYLMQHGTPMDVIETVVTRPSKGTINCIIKHVGKGQHQNWWYHNVMHRYTRWSQDLRLVPVQGRIDVLWHWGSGTTGIRRHSHPIHDWGW